MGPDADGHEGVPAPEAPSASLRAPALGRRSRRCGRPDRARLRKLPLSRHCLRRARAPIRLTRRASWKQAAAPLANGRDAAALTRVSATPEVACHLGSYRQPRGVSGYWRRRRGERHAERVPSSVAAPPASAARPRLRSRECRQLPRWRATSGVTGALAVSGGRRARAPVRLTRRAPIGRGLPCQERGWGRTPDYRLSRRRTASLATPRRLEKRKKHKNS